jgi:hypothetical protein
MNAMLQRRPEIAQRHACAQKLSPVAQFSGRNPALRERTVVQKDGEAPGVKGVGLVGFPHPLLGFGGIGEMRAMAGLLHLVDHPVPMPGGFKCDLARGWQRVEEVRTPADYVRL